jgi:hypothetical protein
MSKLQRPKTDIGNWLKEATFGIERVVINRFVCRFNFLYIFYAVFVT